MWLVTAATGYSQFFCGLGSSPPTLAESLDSASSVVLAQRVSPEQPVDDEDQPQTDDVKPQTTIYRVLQVLKGPPSLAVGQQIVISDRQSGRPGERFVLMDYLTDDNKSYEWGLQYDVTAASWSYLRRLPEPEVPAVQRLTYVLNFLEHPDSIVAHDAYQEFENADFKDLEQIARLLSPDKIRPWLVNSETSPPRSEVYGKLLGLCGDASDVRWLEQSILNSNGELRLGLEGQVSGYLLLSKSSGLDVLDKQVFVNPNACFSDTFACLNALRFMWKYGGDRISSDRLRRSMRLLLERPDIADLALGDLGRWKDWSVQDVVMSKYGNAEFSVPSYKRAVVRYLISSTEDVPSGAEQPPPIHVRHGKELLDKLRQTDPKVVAQVEALRRTLNSEQLKTPKTTEKIDP